MDHNRIQKIKKNICCIQFNSVVVVVVVVVARQGPSANAPMFLEFSVLYCVLPVVVAYPYFGRSPGNAERKHGVSSVSRYMQDFTAFYRHFVHRYHAILISLHKGNNSHKRRSLNQNFDT